MRVLTDDHWAQLKEYLRLSEDPKDLFVELGLHTGARISELLRLNKSNFRGGKVHIKASKSSENRTVKLNEDLMTKIKLLDLTPKQELITLATKSKNRTSQRYIIHRHMSELTNWLLGESYSMHCLRHTILTLLYRRCGDVYLVQQWAGHKSIQSTLKYKHHCRKEEADMMIDQMMKEGF